MRKWIAGLVALVILAGGGYAYADYRLWRAADDALASISAFYDRMGLPPVTAGEITTDVFAQTVVIADVRQAGTAMMHGVQQDIDMTATRVTVTPGVQRGYDLVGEEISSSLTYFAADDTPPLTVSYQSPRFAVWGFLPESLDVEAPAFYGGYAALEVVDVDVAIDRPGQSPTAVHMERVESILRDGDGAMTITGLTAGPLSLEAATLAVRADPDLPLSPASGFPGTRRAVEDMTPEELAALEEWTGDVLRTIKGLSVKGLSVIDPENRGEARLDGFVVEDVTWRGDICTGLKMRLDGLSGPLPDDLDPEVRAYVDGIGLKRPTLSMAVALTYDPEAAVVRVAPLAVTLHQLLSVSLEASASAVHPALGLGEASVEPEEMRRRVMEVLLQIVPEQATVTVEDLGGIKKTLAMMSAEQGKDREDVAHALAFQVAAVVEPVLGRGPAREAFEALHAFLLEADRLSVSAAPRQAAPLMILLGKPPAEILDVAFEAR